MWWNQYWQHQLCVLGRQAMLRKQRKLPLNIHPLTAYSWNPHILMHTTWLAVTMSWNMWPSLHRISYGGCFLSLLFRALCPYHLHWAWPPVLGLPNGSLAKNLPTMQEAWETQVRSLGWKDPLEKEMATHSFSCLKNLMNRGAWQGVVHRVTKSQTQLSTVLQSFAAFASDLNL